MKGMKNTKSIKTDCWYWNNYSDKGSHSDNWEINTALSWDVALPTLNIDQGIVDTFFSQQLLVGALLCDPAVLEHGDLVSVLDGGEAVSDHDARATFPSFIQRLLDDLHREQTRRWALLAAAGTHTSTAVWKLKYGSEGKGISVAQASWFRISLCLGRVQAVRVDNAVMVKRIRRNQAYYWDAWQEKKTKWF